MILLHVLVVYIISLFRVLQSLCQLQVMIFCSIASFSITCCKYQYAMCSTCSKTRNANTRYVIGSTVSHGHCLYCWSSKKASIRQSLALTEFFYLAECELSLLLHPHFSLHRRGLRRITAPERAKFVACATVFDSIRVGGVLTAAIWTLELEDVMVYPENVAKTAE